MTGALLVVIGHGFIITGHDAPNVMGRGIHQLGLWIFFALSGYLICQSWCRDRRVRPYLAKRLLRILPGLWWLLLVSVLVIGPVMTALPLAAYFSDPHTLLYFLKNACLVTAWSLPGVFETQPVRAQMNGSLWSLAIEAGLYLLVPLFAAIWTWQALLAFVLALLAPILVAGLWLADPAALQASFHGVSIGWGIGVAPLFVSGALIGLAGLDGGRARARWLWASAVALVAAAALIRGNSLLSVVVALPFALLIVAIGNSPVLHLRILDRVGDLSYGSYLWAYPVQQAMFQEMGGGPLSNILLSIPVTIGLALFSWHFVERPALRRKPRTRSRRPGHPDCAGQTAGRAGPIHRGPSSS